MNIQHLIKIFLIFLFLGILVYYNSLSNKLLIDDYSFFINPAITKIKFLSLQWIPYREQVLGIIDPHMQLGSYYRPLAHIVPALCYSLFGNHFWQYHLFNLVLLVIDGFLIYICVGRISNNSNLAFLSGLFYIVHPINGIIVNYITASVFAFQVFFILASIICLWESLLLQQSRILYFSSLIFFVLALFCHETSIMVPFYAGSVLLLAGGLKPKKLIACLIPYLLILLVYMVFRMNFVSLNDIVLRKFVIYRMNFFEYLATVFKLLMWYFAKLFYPQGIVIMWSTPVVRDHVFGWCFGMVFLSCLTALSVILRPVKIVLIALMWFIIGLLPIFMAAFSWPQNGADIEPHWFIFSVIGFFILIAYFLLSILRFLKRGYRILILSCLVLVWGGFSHAYNSLWSDEQTYARYWSAQVPHLKLPYFYLAHAYQLKEDWVQARKNYQLSLAGDYGDFEIFNNLGNIELNQAHLKEAEAYYKSSLRIEPSSSGVNHNLGVIYLRQGKLELAQGYFLRAIVLNPFQTESFKFLIAILLDKKDMVNLRKYSSLYINIEEDPEKLTNFGILMSENQIFDIAWNGFQKALNLDTEYKNAYLNAGIMLFHLKKYDEAIGIWKLGLKIDPSDSRFTDNIAKLNSLKNSVQSQ